MKALALFLALFYFWSPTTYYVDTTGVDSPGNGSAFSPFHTLQYAMNVVNCGDEIDLIGGTYNGSFGVEYGIQSTCTSWDSPITVTAYCPGGVCDTVILTNYGGQQIGGFSGGVDDRLPERRKLRPVERQRNVLDLQERYS